MRSEWWLVNASQVALSYGGYVNYVEGFYLCPECGEPVYNDDWDDIAFHDFICPICEFFEEEF